MTLPRKRPLAGLYNQFRVQKEGTKGTPMDKVNKKQTNKKKRSRPRLLFRIDKWAYRGSEQGRRNDICMREKVDLMIRKYRTV